MVNGRLVDCTNENSIKRFMMVTW